MILQQFIGLNYYHLVSVAVDMWDFFQRKLAAMSAGQVAAKPSVM